MAGIMANKHGATAGRTFSSKFVNLNKYLEKKGFDVGMNSEEILNKGNIDGVEMAAFNRYGITYADDEISSTLGYVFIVRPDLNIIDSKSSTSHIELLEQSTASPEINYVAMTDPLILLALTQHAAVPYQHHFIPFLTHRVLEYQVPDLTLSTHEMTQPYTGFKTMYGGNTNGSLSGANPTIRFREYKNYRIMKLFDVWINYINGLSLDIFAPRDEYARAKYVRGSQVIDYATSIYYIKTRPDGEIVFFHKVTGAFPVQVPLSTYSYNRGGMDENAINIEFVGGYPESLNLRTLADFNYNAFGELNPIISIDDLAPDYDFRSPISSSGTGDIFTSNPAIIWDTAEKKFFLCWKKLSQLQDKTVLT